MQSGGGSAPTLNAGQVAQQQQQSNVQTGIANATLGNTNQVTPYGNLTYNETGGKWVGDNWVPSYTATQTLSPEQQAIYDKTTGLQSGALDTAGQLLPKVNTAINTPLTDNTTLRNNAYDALTARSTEDLGHQLDAQKVQLANQGIQPGSEAYNRAIEPFTRATTDASNQALLQAGNIGAQDLATQQTIRNQPLQDYSTLLGLGGGVTNPNYAPATQATIPATDTTSPAIAAFQGQTNAYNQGVASNNAMMGGLFGLGGSLGGAGLLKYSDRRLKSNIARVGAAGRLPLYVYEIGGMAEIGVMADEVMAIKPWAVHMAPNGFLMVDYAEALRG